MIVCPRCGGGVFQTEEAPRADVSSGEPPSNSDADEAVAPSGQKKRWLKGLFGRENTEAKTRQRSVGLPCLARGLNLEFEAPRSGGPYRCSDSACPCSGTESLVLGETGFVYISDEVVRNRRNLQKWDDAQAHLDELARKRNVMMLHFAAGVYVPILVCRQGATARNLDLRVAAEDAARWLSTGLLPLRATPRA